LELEQNLARKIEQKRIQEKKEQNKKETQIQLQKIEALTQTTIPYIIRTHVTPSQAKKIPKKISHQSTILDYYLGAKPRVHPI